MRVAFLFFVFTSLLTLRMAAQTLEPSVISAGGEVSGSPSIQLEWTIGEPAVEYHTGAERSYTEGFHQPILNVQRVDPAIIQPPKPHQVSDAYDAIQVYPNPVNAHLNVEFNFNTETEVELLLSQVNGDPLMAKKIPTGGRQAELDMSGLVPGLYFLQFRTTQGERIATFKISKIQ